jgi:hypothetical protein
MQQGHSMCCARSQIPRTACLKLPTLLIEDMQKHCMHHFIRQYLVLGLLHRGDLPALATIPGFTCPQISPH